MIGRLSGTLLEKDTQSLVMDVGGVGYELEVPLSTAFALPDMGEPVSLFTHFVVREDAQLLYGFLKRSDRDAFRILIRVNGVGPKLGIAILSGLDSHALARCVEDHDVATLVKLPGIGKKTAERLLIELRDKFTLPETGEAPADNSGSAPARSKPGASLEEEAESALLALGYKPPEAARAIKAARDGEQNLEELIKAALKSMM